MLVKSFYNLEVSLGMDFFVCVFNPTVDIWSLPVLQLPIEHCGVTISYIIYASSQTHTC